jgi:hypothetical protein
MNTAPPPELNAGLLAYDQADYRKAERIFNQIIAGYPGAVFLPQAQWMLAKSVEGQGELERALTQYQLFVQNYPAHPSRSDADLKIAELKEKLFPLPRDRQMHLAVILSLSDQWSTELLDRWMEGLEKAGVDSLVVKLFHNDGQSMPSGVFFQTNYAPVLTDQLTFLVKAAHGHRLKIFAWMSLRQMNWKINSDPEWADLKYDSHTLDLIPYGSLDLFRPAVHDYLTRLYRDLAGYPLDGILFGEDLYYRTDEGLSEPARRQYSLDFGEVFQPKVLSQGSLMVSNDIFWRWVGWKSRQVYHFLGLLKEAIRNTNPELQIGLTLSEETVLNPIQALTTQSQDILEAKQLMLDYYIIPVELTNTHDDLIRVSQIMTKSHSLLGQVGTVMLKVRIQGSLSRDSSQALVSAGESDPSLYTRLSSLSREMKLESLELILKSRYP